MDVAKQVKRLNKEWKAQGVAELSLDDNVKWLDLTLSPKEGDFAGAHLEFVMKLKESRVEFISCSHALYHCNIDWDFCPEYRGHEVWYSLLDDFKQQHSLDTYVSGLIWLLDNPNFESALSDYYVEEPEARKRKVQLSIRGLVPGLPECLQPNQPPMTLTTHEALTWFSRNHVAAWWSEVTMPNGCTLGSAHDSIHLLIERNIDFKIADPREQNVFWQAWDNAQGKRIVTLARTVMSKETTEIRIGQVLYSPHWNVQSTLTGLASATIYSDDFQDEEIILTLSDWGDGFRGTFELCNRARTSPRLKHQFFAQLLSVNAFLH